MSRERSDLRRRIGRIRREIAGKAIVPAMSPPPAVEDRPEWLPEDWTMELKKRDGSCLSRNRIDRYYICPLSGKKLRSRLEVLRFLNIKMLDRPTTSSKAMVVKRQQSLAVTGKRPEWLPEGWSVEFRKRNTSDIIDKYYICPLSGKKLRSRLEVMRFLNIEMLDRPTTSSKAMVVKRQRSLAVAGKRPEWVPEGWLVEFRKRKTSDIIDKYYICPLSGIKFRSKPEVMRFLNNEMLDHPASGLAPFDQGYKPLAQLDHSPSGLPDGWIKENRLRKDGSRTDSYYICPINGYGFRSKKDAIRYLESPIAFSQESVHTPDAYSLKEEFLPLIAYKKSKVKRTVARRRLFAREEPVPNACMDITVAIPQKPVSSSLVRSSAQLDDGASVISCLTPENVEHLKQRIRKCQIEWQPDLAFHGEELQGQPAIKMLPGPGNEKLLLIQLEGERLPVPDANLSEVKQFELTKEQSQRKRHIIGEEIQEQPATKILREAGNDELSEPLLQLDGERLPVPDANLSEEKQLELTKNHSQPKRRSTGEELQEQPATKILRDSGNEKLSEPLLQLEGERLPVPDANSEEEKQFELTKKQSQPKSHSMGEELREQSAIKILQKPGNKKLSGPLMQLEGKRLPVSDANLSEDRQLELTQKQSPPKRLGISEELKGQQGIKVLLESGNEKLPERLMQLEGERLPVPDVNLSEFELTEKLSKLKKRSQPQRHGIGEELQGQQGIKVMPESGNEKISESLMQLEGERLPIPYANLSEENQFELTEKLCKLKKRSQPKRHGIGEEFQGQQGIKVLPGSGNEKLSESLMQLKGERLPIPDANLSEENRFELTEKLIKLKRHSQPKRPGLGEELQGQLEIKILRDPGHEKLSESLMQLEGERLPIPDANLSEENQFELTEKLSKLKKRSQPKRRGIREELQGQLEIKILQDPRNGKLSESLMQLDGETQPVPDANPSEDKQFELNEKLSKFKRHSRGCQRGSRKAEAVSSVIDQPRPWKRKAEKAENLPVRTSKRLAGVAADIPVSNVGAGNQFRRGRARQIEQAQSIVPKESDASCSLHQKDISITDELEEKLKSLKPFVEQPSQEQQADQPQQTEPKDSDASCRSHKKETHVTNELREKLERLKPFIEQASQKQQGHQPQPVVLKDLPETDELQEKFKRLFVEASEEQPSHLLSTLPFGDSWPDPCIEFAFKTLTSDFPVLEDIAAIQDYFSHQPVSSEGPNHSAGSIPLAFGGASLENGKAKKDGHQIRGLKH